MRLSLEKFARRLGVSRRAVSYWESGRKAPNHKAQCDLDAVFSKQLDPEHQRMFLELMSDGQPAGIVPSPPAITATDLTLMLVGGFAGSGKTEFARLLSAVNRWQFFDKDEITRPLVEGLLVAHGGDPHDRHSDLYLTKVRPAEYKALMTAALASLEAKRSVIVAAPFLREVVDEGWLSSVHAQAASRHAQVRVVWVSCDETSMRGYLTRRNAERDFWKLANWKSYVDSIDMNMRPLCPHDTVENSRHGVLSVAEQVLLLASR